MKIQYRQSETPIIAKATTPRRTFLGPKKGISFAGLVSASKSIACANCKAGVTPSVSSSWHIDGVGLRSPESRAQISEFMRVEMECEHASVLGGGSK